ncbi:MAG: AAA family ATPase [Gemmobacter sp.]
MLRRIEFAHEVRPIIDRGYVVKGVLDRDAVSVLYGDANAGKSFLALDIAHHVHEGAAWAGCRVRAGGALYIAAEGGAMFANRLAARKARLHVLRGSVRLAGKNPDALPLADAMKRLQDTQGFEYRLIVLDTLARVMGAADENAADGIADLLRQVDVLRHTTAAHVLVVHHSGKDVTRGARGHSSLRAAVDTELRVTVADDGWRTIEATKQRDMAADFSRRFKLRVVELGRDADGDPVTSCIVEHEPMEAPRML